MRSVARPFNRTQIALSWYGRWCIRAEPGIDKRDPRWIGAWWLGFVICGACTCVWSFAVMMFPPKLAGADNHAAAGKETNVLSNVRGLFRRRYRESL